MHSVVVPRQAPLAEPGPWNSIAVGYDEVAFGQLTALYDAAIELLRPERGDRILDVAAGPGTLAVRLAPRVGHVVAIDFAEGMLERLRGHIMRRRLANLEAKLMNGEELSFEDASFDAAASLFGVCSFDDRVHGLEEMLRVIVPGGHALSASWAAPEVNTWQGLAERALRVALADVSFELFGALTSDPERCASELEQAGFEPIAVVPFEQSLAFASVAEYWRGLERCFPELALLAARIGPEAYAAGAARAQDFLRAECGQGSFELRCAALFSWGERPLSAA